MATPSLIITPEIIVEFREYYEEFADVTKWSDSKIRTALNIALGEIGGCGCSSWGSYLPAYSIFQRGLFALAAHNLLVRQAAFAAGSTGGATTPFAVASKSVRDESVSYAVPGYMANLSAWESLVAQTPYGLEFLHLRYRAGMGAICV